MNKFTRITLLIVAVMAGTGILLCGISALMGGGYGAVRRMAQNGELGDWHVGDGEDGWFWENGWFWDDDGFWDDDEDSSKVYTYDAAQVSTLKIDIDTTELVIEEGAAADQIVVELYRCKENYFTEKIAGGELKLVYDMKNPSRKSIREKITVKLPKEMYLELLSVDAGAANIRIGHTSLYCDTAEMDIGAGNVEVDGFTVRGTFDVEAGAGNVDIRGGEYQNIKMECSLGNFAMKGRVNGDLEAECSMGNMELMLSGKESEYNYELSCSMGEMEVNGTVYPMINGSRHQANEGAIGTIRLDCAMGNMDLTFLSE